MELMLVHSQFWRRKRVFLTGHTGFKGSWLSLWLQSMGAEVQGFALDPPTTPNLFKIARVADGMTSTIGDIRDFETLSASMQVFQPDIVIHLAAQALVRLSYQKPVETYATNVMGTVNLLEAARRVESVQAIINVTTDKCYENREWVWGYREDEAMGGHDPYSSSKGCAELVTAAYRRSFFQSGTAVASVRAGNVIGGGDWAEDRLVPDILRALAAGQPIVVRNPQAIRPWQHVLEPLGGYLALAERLSTDGTTVAEGWNFGPVDEDARPVRWIVEQIVDLWGDAAAWLPDTASHPHEANYLKLDISKARHRLGWSPRWSLGQTLEHIVEWQRSWLAGADMRAVSVGQIARYMEE
ncbi:CDP-glucose 4,6-dehydratase [Sphingosinicella soli]|uniref:CDP-glucose 4,6-dehydratase n=2 Tax=Sphingosinicella soli TaxID=333708 RepID=A0A7W7F5P0_9SPHN|nr:CDP-glucose 4,6-dehydratase [Sphingosinicella soli]